ncbi:MAG: FAD-dependent oxidoreductase [Planctomycetia bacterium]|nr:FAD-dependent oxidoreductase [Planctomycetia bacterium]
MKRSKYLIVGNSTAAVGAVEAIRQYDTEGSLTIVSDEKHPVYSRPLISYLLEEKTTVEKMKYRDDDFYQTHGIRLLSGIRATSLDPVKKRVTLSDGTVEEYEKLLLATGSVPFLPPTPGCPEVNTGKGVFTFIKLDDALALRQTLTPESRVVVVGGGLTGVKATEGILHTTRHVTMVELAPRVLPMALDDDASQVIQKRLTDAGVTVCCGASVAQVETTPEGCVSGVVLTDGRTIPCDVLVLSIGVRPNVALLEGTTIRKNRGIVIDRQGQTSVPDIYAAGDCVESLDRTDNQYRILAILPNAYRQGKIAGTSMAGGTDADQGTFPINATSFLGLPLITAGLSNPRETAGLEIVVTSEEQNYRKLVLRDGKLVGFILLGYEVTKRAGIFTSFLRDGTDLATLSADIRTASPELLLLDRATRTAKIYQNT